MVHYEHFYSCNLYKVNFKLIEKLPEILVSNVSNGSTLLLFLVCNFVNESQRGSQPLTWSYHITHWFWRGYLTLVQKIKIQIYVQGYVLLTVLDFPVFPNIAPSTTFHFHWCKVLFPEHLLSGSTIINSLWWCYNC